MVMVRRGREGKGRAGKGKLHLDTSGLALVHGSGHGLARGVDERHEAEEDEALLGLRVDGSLRHGRRGGGDPSTEEHQRNIGSESRG